MNRSAKILLVKSLALLFGLVALSAPARTISGFGDMPLFFESRMPGQFSASSPGCDFIVQPNGAEMIVGKNNRQPESVRMQFVNANVATSVRGEDQLAAKINYLVGNQDQWRSGISTFSRVRIQGVYPGIDAIYHGNQKQLEYDFEIAPGADPRAIVLRFDGMQKISIEAGGDLVLKLSDGEIRQPAPEIFQTINGQRKMVDGGYHLLDTHTVGFAVHDYDRSQPLTIDPTLGFATYFGGTRGDIAWSVALGSDGSVYVAGETLSKFLTNRAPFTPFSTSGAFQETFGGGKLAGDGFVAKFDLTGTNLVYCTYLGGSNDEYIADIAVNAAGNAFVAGFTDSTDFPTTNALFSTVTGRYNKTLHAFPSDAFVSELDPSGSSLLYSTRLGGSSWDGASALALDASDNVYITGFTSSTNLPTTNSLPFLAQRPGTNSAFVAEIAAGGTSMPFCTYLGGSAAASGQGIAVTNGNIYVSGYTDSTNFPTTNAIMFTNIVVGITNQPVGTNVVDGAHLNSTTNRSFNFDAFVTKLQPSGPGFAYVYSTLLGGFNNDFGYRVACDGAGSAYLTGYSSSTNFPNIAIGIPGFHSFVETNRIFSIQNKDVFLTKITDTAGKAGIGYSAMFGGKDDDVGYGVDVDAAGNAVVTGSTQSTNFPVIATIPFQLKGTTGTNLNVLTGRKRHRHFPSDAFVTAFDPTGTNIIYSTLLGGSKADAGYNLKIDGSGNVFVVGQSMSTNFPTLSTDGTFRNGTNDAFLVEIKP
jgi:Beta-propeller repeat